MKDIIVPIWEKSHLTIDEASAYSGIGKNTMRNLCNAEDCDFVLWIGAKRLIKRQKLDEYLTQRINAKLKMHKNANSKCTILVIVF